jgi:hypothetical protein
VGGLAIRGYYFPAGTKRIRWSDVRGVDERPLGALTGRLRIWGSGDPRLWWHLDPRRPRKRTALVIDLGRRIRPAITPDDPAAVLRIIEERTGPR